MTDEVNVAETDDVNVADAEDVVLDSGRNEHIPEHHHGLYYLHFLGELSKKRPINNYLEVGVQKGVLMSKITARHAYAVDPAFMIEANLAENKKHVSMFHQTSDEFFAEWGGPVDGRPVDFAFLDGFHTFEYLLRDFYNLERFSSPSTLVGMHDCLPLNEFMADRNEIRAIERGEGNYYAGAWTGDVWKIVPILKKYRPDLSVVCVDASPTGVVFVTNLDRNNRVLQDNYLDIVREFTALPNDAEAIGEMYVSNELVSAQKITNDFDHSLYFRA